MNRNRSRTKIWKRSLACLAVAALVWPQAVPAAAAAKALEEGRPVYPGENKCPYDLPSHIEWTEQEKWAWSTRICRGKIANMSDFGGGDGVHCEPEAADDWPDTRDLSSALLETILNHEPYRGALPRTGVRIKCARCSRPGFTIAYLKAMLASLIDIHRPRAAGDALHGVRLAAACEVEAAVADDDLPIALAVTWEGPGEPIMLKVRGPDGEVAVLLLPKLALELPQELTEPAVSFGPSRPLPHQQQPFPYKIRW